MDSISISLASQFMSKFVEAGGTADDLEAAIEVPDNGAIRQLLTFLQESEKYEETESQQRARAIMGHNFLGIDLVIKHFGIRFTAGKLAKLAAVPFSDEVLEARKDTHVLFCGAPLTILELEKRSGKRFEIHQLDREQPFVTTTRADYRWYLLRKGAIPGSTLRSYEEQVALLTEREAIPRACEVVYMITLYELAKGARLKYKPMGRCSDSISPPNIRWHSKVVGDGEIVVGTDSSSTKHSGIGLASEQVPAQ